MPSRDLSTPRQQRVLRCCWVALGLHPVHRHPVLRPSRRHNLFVTDRCLFPLLGQGRGRCPTFCENFGPLFVQICGQISSQSYEGMGLRGSTDWFFGSVEFIKSNGQPSLPEHTKLYPGCNTHRFFSVIVPPTTLLRGLPCVPGTEEGAA